MVGQLVKKIAINITYEVDDLEEIHANVINFLFQGGEHEYNFNPGGFKIDYYICHRGIVAPKTENKFYNSTVYYSPATNEDIHLKSIEHHWNTDLIKAVKDLCIRFFRSYVNTIEMHRHVFEDTYDCVVNYSDKIKNYKVVRHYRKFDFEDNFFFCDVIAPVWPNIDTSFFVTTQSTFFKVVMFWKFVRLLDDWSWGHDWWRDWKKDPKTAESPPEGFMLPDWLNMQNIRIRHAISL